MLITYFFFYFFLVRRKIIAYNIIIIYAREKIIYRSCAPGAMWRLNTFMAGLLANTLVGARNSLEICSYRRNESNY